MQEFGQDKERTFLLYILCLFVAALLIYFLLVRKETVLSLPEAEVEKVAQHLPDFSEYTVVRDRKEAFFAFLSPLAEKVNGEIKADRELLKQLQKVFRTRAQLSSRQRQELETLADKYRVEDYQALDVESIINTLQRRVAPIPKSLILAQAANESAWGRSRFALEGNNLFGQWCFEPGCGLVPSDRPAGKRYEVAMFRAPIDSIRSYVMNLNTFSAYRELREIRLQLQQQQQPVTGTALADGLINYSTRREEYIAEIKLMIEQNHLEQ
ncbi:MAG: glucosaminidase domain-containing protein [Gammaproteobacteria bacterium]|nr:glucosaminidase domain-containing protein [Gammaproteobacteria bacterium]